MRLAQSAAAVADGLYQNVVHDVVEV